MNRIGSDDVWRELLTDAVREHGRLLFRLAYGILRQSAHAEEVCQQAFLNAWEQRQTLQGPGALRAWLTKIVVNESLQFARRCRLERQGLESGLSLPDLPEVMWREADARESVTAALGKLPELTRAVVALRLMEGMSGNQVKDMLGCSATEVSRQLYAGMEQLRGFLREWDETVPGAGAGQTRPVAAADSSESR